MKKNIKEICLNITRRCNLHCEYCYVLDYVNMKNSKEQLDLPLSNIKNLVDLTIINTVFLTGGEPFTHPEIKDIIKYFYDSNIKINIATNALLLDKAMIEYLDNKNITLLISLREQCDDTIRIINEISNYKIDIICYHIPLHKSPLLLDRLLKECPKIQKIKLLYDSKNPPKVDDWFSLLNEIYLKVINKDVDFEVEIGFLPKENKIARDSRRGAFDRIQVSTEGEYYYCPLLVPFCKGRNDLNLDECTPDLCPVLSKKLDNEKFTSVCTFLVTSLKNAILIGKYGGAIT